MNDLKPCPFCGFEYPSIYQHSQLTSPYNSYYTVKCEECGVEVNAEAWNRRANDEEPMC